MEQQACHRLASTSDSIQLKNGVILMSTLIINHNSQRLCSISDALSEKESADKRQHNYLKRISHQGCTYLSYVIITVPECGNFFSCLSINPGKFVGWWGDPQEPPISMSSSLCCQNDDIREMGDGPSLGPCSDIIVHIGVRSGLCPNA
jgi:hypothetical protein